MCEKISFGVTLYQSFKPLTKSRCYQNIACVCWRTKRVNVYLSDTLIDPSNSCSFTLINRVKSYSVYVCMWDLFFDWVGAFQWVTFWVLIRCRSNEKFFCLRSSTQRQQIKWLITVLLKITRMADKVTSSQHIYWQLRDLIWDSARIKFNWPDCNPFFFSLNVFSFKMFPFFAKDVQVHSSRVSGSFIRFS